MNTTEQVILFDIPVYIKTDMSRGRVFWQSLLLVGSNCYLQAASTELFVLYAELDKAGH